MGRDETTRSIRTPLVETGITGCVFEYPAAAAAAWVVDIGATYDVAPIGMASEQAPPGVRLRRLDYEHSDWED